MHACISLLTMMAAATSAIQFTTYSDIQCTNIQKVNSVTKNECYNLADSKSVIFTEADAGTLLGYGFDGCGGEPYIYLGSTNCFDISKHGIKSWKII